VPAKELLVVPTDVTDPASIESRFETVKATYGRIDLLFNNAGTSTRTIPIEDLTLAQWSNVVAVNLTGSFLCAQHAFRMMRGQQPRGGRIINNGSNARIDVNDVARGVAYMASLSLDANVQFMTMMATKIPCIGRG